MKNTTCNPISLPVKTRDGAADPFIMRYNGWYYLYTTGEVNIWRSRDLADWTYAGTANPQKPLKAAYAPEVYYRNGQFYMYTSPAGNGHYVLRSDQPDGPFEPVTDNIGLTIDGSIFMEDDGSWYFTHAGDRGILGHSMSSPTEIDLPGKLLGSTYMGHWTEGPMILKRDGRYFLTYTGNHFQSSGYRVNYSVSGDGPLGPYRRPTNNPILINDQDSQHSLGHSSFVPGPDLDSVYIAYHCYSEGVSPRLLNLDRLSFNGSRMTVNGPTWFPMPKASLPNFALWPENDPVSHMETSKDGEWKILLSREKTQDCYTAEWNLSGGSGDTGIVCCSDGKGSDIRLLREKDGTEMKIEKHSRGTAELLGTFDLPEGFDWKVLHTIRIQFGPQRLDVFLDNMHQLTCADPGPGAGKIGYIYTGSRPEIGFTGFSDACRGSGDGQSVKPVPGQFDAIHHLPGEGEGFGGKVGTGSLPGDVRTLKLKEEGAWASYAVNVEKEGLYGVALQMRRKEKTTDDEAFQDSKLEILQDGKSLDIFSAHPQNDSQNGESRAASKGEKAGPADLSPVPLGKIRLSSGQHRLTFRFAGGRDPEILDVQLYHAESLGFPMDLPLTRKQKEMKIIGSPRFVFRAEGMKMPRRGDGKMITGSKAWTDYTVQVTVTPGSFGMGRSGLMVRSTNESYHPDQNPNAMQGYFIGMESDGISLWRMNYEDSRVMEKVPFQPEKGKEYTLRGTVRGSCIQVYLNDRKDPVISCTDPEPFLYGRIGIWSFHEEAVYRDLKAWSD